VTAGGRRDSLLLLVKADHQLPLMYGAILAALLGYRTLEVGQGKAWRPIGVLRDRQGIGFLTRTNGRSPLPSYCGTDRAGLQNSKNGAAHAYIYLRNFVCGGGDRVA